MLDTYTWKGASLLHGGILLNVIAVAQLLKRDHRPSIKKPLSDIPHLLLPLNSPPRRRLLAQEHSGSRQPLQRSPKTSQKHVENGNGNPSSVYLKENSWNNKFKRFSLKLYTITGCGSSTCAYDIVLFVGCVVVLTGHSSSIAKLIIRADSLGIRSNQLSALMPIYISLGVISRYIIYRDYLIKREQNVNTYLACKILDINTNCELTELRERNQGHSSRIPFPLI